MRDVQGSVVDNRYDVERPLGSGGMGEVYLARDMTLGRDVALKLLRSQFANDRDSAERFKREATSAARLSHPNIVQVYDRGDAEDGTSYIAMEYVPGGTLKDRINQDGPLDSRLAASFGYQVAEALGAAHAKGVIHRDIKPQNVLITASGEAKVADFGIARALSAATDSQTKTGTVMGTAGYMSPEQALGEPATPKSDLYSLGIVLYEAITGRLPFTAENPIAVSMKHVNEPPRPPQQLNPDVPDSMNAIVLKLLSKAPDDRYADADGLAEDLYRVRQGIPPASGALPAEAKTVETPTRRPAPTTPQAATARSRRRRTRGPLLLGLLLLLLGLLGLVWALGQGFGPLGAQGVEVPSVEGLPREQAEARLDSAGLVSEVRTREDADAEAGTVISQSPAGGGSANRGSTVTLTVARSSTVAVPEVVGLNVSDAEAALEGVGLTVGSRYEVQSETAAEGVVVEQGIATGQEVSSGTAVNIGVSSGAAAPASASPDSSASPAASQETVSSPAPAADDASADSSASPQAAPQAAPQAEPDLQDPGAAEGGVQAGPQEAREPEAGAPKVRGPKAPRAVKPFKGGGEGEGEGD